MSSRSIALLVAGLGTTSCLLVDDFDDLHEGAGGGSAGSTSSDVASSASGQVGSGAGGDDGTTTSGSASTQTGTAGAGGGGGQGVGGQGGGQVVGPPRAHDSTFTVRPDEEECRVDITDLAHFGEGTGQGTVFVGVTTPLSDEVPCSTIATYGVVGESFETEPRQTTAWYLRYTGDVVQEQTLSFTPRRSETEITPVRLAVAGDRIWVAYDASTDAGDRQVVVADVTDEPDRQEFRLASTGDVQVRDLFAVAGRIYLAGVADGTTSAAGACATGDSSASFDDGSFLWSIDGEDCEIASLGDDTEVYQATSHGSISIVARGILDLGLSCAVDASTDLGLYDLEALPADGLQEGCIGFERLGTNGAAPPSFGAFLAADDERQLLGLVTDDGPRLRERTAGDLGEEAPFSGAPRIAGTFVMPNGTRGAFGTHSSAFGYEGLAFEQPNGVGAFLVTSNGSHASSFVLDDVGFESITAVVPFDAEWAYVAGQYQQGLEEELGMSAEDDLRPADPPGISAFCTLIPMP